MKKSIKSFGGKKSVTIIKKKEAKKVKGGADFIIEDMQAV